MSVNIIKVFIL